MCLLLVFNKRPPVTEEIKMPADNNNNSRVFDMRTAVTTTTPVPPAGSDNHAPEGDQANLDRVTDTSFINDLSFGQYQNLCRTADYVEHFQNNQIVTVEGSQSTVAQQKITITSVENEIHVIAATTITLEVGESKIVMTKDGKIEITGIDIDIKASGRNTIIGEQRVDINPLAPQA
jgi:hypothetical protein